MDLSLAGCARVAIDRFCSVQHHLADMPKALDWNGDRNPALRWWYDILSHVPQNAIERPSSLLSVWFGKAPQYLISFVENLELIAAIRPVVPYEIQLAPESVALERVAETAQTKAWEIISG